MTDQQEQHAHLQEWLMLLPLYHVIMVTGAQQRVLILMKILAQLVNFPIAPLIQYQEIAVIALLDISVQQDLIHSHFQKLYALLDITAL
jgi:hypothetical protein